MVLGASINHVVSLGGGWPLSLSLLHKHYSVKVFTKGDAMGVKYTIIRPQGLWMSFWEIKEKTHFFVSFSPIFIISHKTVHQGGITFMKF